MSKSGIMYIIKKSKRRSEIQPHCGWLRDSNGDGSYKNLDCVDKHL